LAEAGAWLFMDQTAAGALTLRTVERLRDQVKLCRSGRVSARIQELSGENGRR